jgi:hypothetical protein
MVGMFPNLGAHNANINNMFQNYVNNTGQISQYNQFLSQLGMQNAIQTAQAAYLGALTEYEGTIQQNAINDYSTRATVALDLQNLALTTNYGILSKQTEMTNLDLQMLEKHFGNVLTIFQTTTDNTMGRLKQVAQSFKY